jgi:hypothetical protein
MKINFKLHKMRATSKLKHDQQWQTFNELGNCSILIVLITFYFTCLAVRSSTAGAGTATSRKVSASIPCEGFFEIFHRLNPSGRTMALGSTQPLTEMSTRDRLWGIKTDDAQG